MNLKEYRDARLIAEELQEKAAEVAALLNDPLRWRYDKFSGPIKEIRRLIDEAEEKTL